LDQLERALEIRRGVLGPDHPETTESRAAIEALCQAGLRRACALLED
jgi:hypothetical protein